MVFRVVLQSFVEKGRDARALRAICILVLQIFALVLDLLSFQPLNLEEVSTVVPFVEVFASSRPNHIVCTPPIVGRLVIAKIVLVNFRGCEGSAASVAC